MTCDVQVLAKSRNPAGVVLSTLQLRYWRAIHAELMTHRVFSRNASSSRAVPVKTMLAQVWNDPAGPAHWGRNQAGMQAHAELQGWRLRLARFLWMTVASRVACVLAWACMQLGLHKQVANRLLEPWMYIHVVLSATEWENFFELRCHGDAEPTIRELAWAIKHALDNAPTRCLCPGQWHLPYVPADFIYIISEGRTHIRLAAIKASVARCARSSYITHGDTRPDLQKDIKLHDRLVVSKPMHASPAEHQAMALASDRWVKNFRGFRQYRDFLEQGDSPCAATV